MIGRMSAITPEFLQTLTDALASASQTNQHALISQINISSFSGEGDSVHKFVERFEEATIDLNEVQRAKTIGRFLKDSARIWYNLEIRDKEPAAKYTDIKTKIKARFGSNDETGYHLDKLRVLKLDPATKNLSNFVEKVIYHSTSRRIQRQINQHSSRRFIKHTYLRTSKPTSTSLERPKILQN